MQHAHPRLENRGYTRWMFRDVELSVDDRAVQRSYSFQPRKTPGIALR